jgi:hypothetical protein
MPPLVQHLLLEPLLQQLEAHDLLKTRGTQRTDSTHILAAIRTLNRLECDFSHHVAAFFSHILAVPLRLSLL